MGKRRGKKNRTHVVPDVEELGKVPKSFVMKSGQVGTTVGHLVRDVRKVMEPNTAIKLKEQKSNRIKDFLHVAGQYSVSHFMIFTRTDIGTYLKVTRIPRGPTLNFRVVSYSLARDVLKSLKKPKTAPSDFLTPPLLVLNNFGEELPNARLVTTMFQNMFPAINVQKMKLAEARRVLLLNYNSDTGHIDFRHFGIVVKTVGISKGIKRIITANVPSLGKFDDISEYVIREAVASESDIEDGPEASVTLAQNYMGRNNREAETRAIKLTELGPRLELDLVKIQSGMLNGEVLYHKYVKKSAKEQEAQTNAYKEKQAAAEKRRKQQELNVQRKKDAIEAHRIACGGQPKKDDDEEFEESDNENDDELDIKEDDDVSVKNESEEDSEQDDDDMIFDETKVKEEDDENLFDESDDGDMSDSSINLEVKEEEEEISLAPKAKKQRKK